MNVVLTKELEEFVKAKVAGGRYLDESEVIREAIRNLEALECHESPELEAFVLEGLEGDPQPWGPGMKQRILRVERGHASS
jgi:putative addiction module CopG family antidote